METGQGSLAVQGVVTDSVTGDPVKGAVLKFVLNGNSATADLIKKTAEKGGYNIKTIAAGIYTVTVTKTGYTERVTSLTVSDGELSELDIQLTKI
ncbi:MAG: carboxypeptidase regulatory-like domain-containing protein [Chlorobiales bacterium]|nr:carboxypeptidase regulatory-like domain-containing protein [Chlorobiales bacterium]